MIERYVELHSASAFSFLEGASQPEELIQRAVELNMPAMALLDRNGVYGAARFHTSAKRNGVRAHVGAEIATSSFGLRLRPPAWLPNQYEDEPARLALLCESRAGYQNLCQLVTQFKMRESKKVEGAATWDDLQQYSAGLVCLTGGDEGPLAAALANGGEQQGRKTVERLIQIFGRDSVYVEVQRHHEREGEWRNQAALRIAMSVFGLWLYLLVVRKLAVAVRPFVPDEAAYNVVGRYAYYAACIFDCAAGALDPLGLKLFFLSTVPAAFGGLSGLMFADSRLPKERAARELMVERQPAWWFAAGVIGIAYIAILGRGIRFG